MRAAAGRLFEALQIRQQIVDPIRLKLDLRHCRMAGGDALGEGLGEGFDRITVVQGSQGWGGPEWAMGSPIDGMTFAAIV